MLTVRNRGGLSFNPCPGLTLITATVTLNPGSDYCNEGMLTVLDVWVNSSTPTIAQSYQAGNSIYTESDCTVCAQVGWYRDINFASNSDFYYFKGCSWQNIGNCSNRQQINVRANSSREPLCDNVGTLISVYLDNNFTAQAGFTTNNIYTTDGIYGNATTNDPPLGINSGYLRTTDLGIEMENSSGVYTRFWTNQFGGAGGHFGTPQQCTLEVVDPPSYYEFEVRKSTSWTPADVCDAAIVTYYLLEGTTFSDGTKLFSDQNGTNAPDAWYRNANTSIQPIPDNPEDDTFNSVFEISGGDGILDLTDAICGRRRPGDPT